MFALLLFLREVYMEEIKRKEYRSFNTRVILYWITYLIAVFILRFKANTFFCGAITTFIYAIIIDIDARVSAERTMKKIENMKN